MAEYSPGTVRVWHGKWQAMINVRDKPTDKWKRKTKVLTCYHQVDADRPGRLIEVSLPEPKGRMSKAMIKEAERALKEWRDELLGAAGCLSGGKATVSEYVSHYLDTLDSNKLVEASTLGVYRQLLKVISRYDIGSVRLDDLRAEDAEAWISQLVEDGRAHSSIRKMFNVLHAAVKHAVGTKRLATDPIATVKTPKIELKDPNSLDAEMRSRLVSYLDIAGLAASNVGFSLALYTGMREGEICGLRWCDVDLDDCLIHVRNVIAHNGNDCYEKVPKTRNGKRDIPISEELSQLLRLRLAACKQECGEAGVRFSDRMYVVGTVGEGNGKWMHPHLLWREWKAVAKSLGLKGGQGKTPTFHDLRHTNATVATHIPGTDLKGVQVNLGHASIKTTVDVYASDDPEARRTVACATADAIRRAKGEANPFGELGPVEK